MGDRYDIAIKENKKSRFIREEIMFHPIVAYTFEVLKCRFGNYKSVFIDEDKDFGDVCLKYQFDVINTWEIDHRAENGRKLVLLSGGNPLISPDLISAALNCSVSTMWVDCFGQETIRVEVLGAGDEQIKKTLGLEHGFEVTSEEKLAMMSGLLRKGLQSEFYPTIKKDAYKIEHFKNDSKPKMLYTAPYSFFSKEFLKAITESFDVTFAYRAPVFEVERLLPNTEVWVVSTCPPYYMGSDLFKLSKDLNIVATPSTGTNHLDKKFLDDKGVKVLSLKGSETINTITASSEFSLALLMNLVKQFPKASNMALSGVWRQREDELRTMENSEKTIGIVGLGRIGKNMARYCEALLMDVVFFDPYVEETDGLNARKCDSLNELLAISDIVSLSYHLNDETKLSFGKAQFDKMKDGSLFLNTARGELVNEEDMIYALKSGKLKAAAVDVISDEHIVNKWNHPVIEYARNHDNLIVSPHIAGLTVDSETKAMKDIIAQIKEHINA